MPGKLQYCIIRTPSFEQDFLLWFSYSIVYTFWISPLRHFPGPRLWALSKIPLSLSVLRGYNHLDILALHARYGPAIRISPDELAFNTTHSFHDIYGHRPGGCFQKDRCHYIPPVNGVDHLLCAVDDANYTRQKRLLAPAFSDKALKDQEGLIRGYVDTLINKLRLRVKHGDSLVDIKTWMNFTTFDITGDLMFGESFDCLKDSQLHPWIQMIFSSLKVMAFIGVFNQFPLIRGALDLLVPAEAKQKSQEHFDLTAQKVDRRLETNIGRPDFVSAILQNGLRDDMGQDCAKKTMTRAEIHSNGFILIIAGSETSATLLSGCLFFLCTHAKAMNRLVSEIRTAFKKDSQITFGGQCGLTYLEAVIEESLRMYPPFVTNLARVAPQHGALVNGQFVPAGTIVSCHHYASYRSESNFAFPNQFMPERWLGTDSVFENDQKDVLQPFSLGPRQCLGKTLAYFEIRLILCKLLFNFDITLSPVSINWPDQKVYLVWEKPALMVKLTDRFPDIEPSPQEPLTMFSQ
ncbi:hypothetical protein PENANT_c003G00194 [Penicillium antarcticum]|uniref:Isotrichodermin C-15 hydroxylase n=1 Tax=Penicillium antarcticum TaxID=416450 RepID=A0A1V6QJ57_9EURO|nr:hypothetical protein PENANT_c003G00194 [Penicillium antarcticum]